MGANRELKYENSPKKKKKIETTTVGEWSSHQKARRRFRPISLWSAWLDHKRMACMQLYKTFFK